MVISHGRQRGRIGVKAGKGRVYKSKGKSILDDKRSFNRRCVYPFLIRVEDLKSLDLRLLPEDRETLPKAFGSALRPSNV